MFKTQITINNLFSQLLFSFILVIGFSLLSASQVESATLSISPSSSTISVGNITAVKVIVNTEGKYINNADAIIQFPTDMLEVVSISKSPSIFSMWVEEPAFSNLAGRVNFNGGVANPGYNGASGTIATITFKAKKQGLASIIFQEGAVRANDGLGTDVLGAKNSSNIQIGLPQKIEVPPTTTEKSSVPSKPIITSNTHPNQNLWYKDSTASFNWKIPSGVTSIQTLLNNNPNSTPTIVYDNSVTAKTLNNLSDGVSYLHLRFFNTAGGSSIAHFKIQIDTVPPSLITPTTTIVDNQTILKLSASDETSGIDYYTVQIDDGEPLIIKKGELIEGEYILPVINEGNHKLIVSAYDKAGNTSESNLIITTGALSAPELSLNLKEIISGDTVIISGRTNYPNKQVEVILESDGKILNKYSQITSDDGSFSVTTDKIKSVGSVSVWAQMVLSDTIKSGPSEKIYLKANETEAVRITLAVLYPLIGLVLVVALGLVLIFLFYLGWHKYFGLKKKIKDESKETASDIHKAMLLLKEELESQLKTLEKVKRDRNLNEKEEEIFQEIKRNIDDLDVFIEKKLKKLM